MRRRIRTSPSHSCRRAISRRPIPLPQGAPGTAHRQYRQWPGIRARPMRPDGRSDRGVPKGDRAQPEVHTGLQQSGRRAGEARKPRRSGGQLSAIARREAERSRVQGTRCGPRPARQKRRGRGTVRQGPGPGFESVSDYPRGARRTPWRARRMPSGLDDCVALARQVPPRAHRRLRSPDAIRSATLSGDVRPARACCVNQDVTP